MLCEPFDTCTVTSHQTIGPLIFYNEACYSLSRFAIKRVHEQSESYTIDASPDPNIYSTLKSFDRREHREVLTDRI